MREYNKEELKKNLIRYYLKKGFTLQDLLVRGTLDGVNFRKD